MSWQRHIALREGGWGRTHNSDSNYKRDSGFREYTTHIELIDWVKADFSIIIDLETRDLFMMMILRTYVRAQ